MIIARIRRCAEPHATKVLIHPAVDALSPRHGLARVMSQDRAAGGGIEGRGSIGITKVCTDRASGRDHGCNAHVASCRDQMLREHVGGSG